MIAVDHSDCALPALRHAQYLGGGPDLDPHLGNVVGQCHLWYRGKQLQRCYRVPKRGGVVSVASVTVGSL